jgi:hypothetical protein
MISAAEYNRLSATMGLTRRHDEHPQQFEIRLLKAATGSGDYQTASARLTSLNQIRAIDDTLDGLPENHEFRRRLLNELEALLDKHCQSGLTHRGRLGGI